MCHWSANSLDRVTRSMSSDAHTTEQLMDKGFCAANVGGPILLPRWNQNVLAILKMDPQLVCVSFPATTFPS